MFYMRVCLEVHGGLVVQEEWMGSKNCAGIGRLKLDPNADRMQGRVVIIFLSKNPGKQRQNYKTQK